MKTKKSQNTAQQGDVNFRRLQEMPTGEIKIIAKKRLVVAEGEATGHNHVIEDEDAELIQIGDRMLVRLAKAATIKHQEHNPITLAPGIWEVGRVQEFDYFKMMSRQVID